MLVETLKQLLIKNAQAMSPPPWKSPGGKPLAVDQAAKNKRLQETLDRLHASEAAESERTRAKMRELAKPPTAAELARARAYMTRQRGEQQQLEDILGGRQVF
jgi:hypothetical protein